MDDKTPIQEHVRAFERNAINAFAPLNEMMNQSRAYFEKSLHAMREESLELLNRLHERNGEMLSGYTSSPNLAAWTAAQEKWIADLSREFLQSSIRFQQTARHFLADSIESVSHSVRHGAVAKAADEADAHATDAAEHVAEAADHVADAAAPAEHAAEDAAEHVADAADPHIDTAPAHPEHAY